MAYRDTLFQLGMDLTRSSTAQKEDRRQSAQVARSTDTAPRLQVDRQSNAKVSDDGYCVGQHLVIDLFDAGRLNDLKHIERTLEQCVGVAGGALVHIHLHQLAPNGSVSGVAVFTQGHISMHSWPDVGYAALDVFMRGDAEAQRTVDLLQDAFSAGSVAVKEHKRGEEFVQRGWQPPVTKKTPARPRKARAA